MLCLVSLTRKTGEILALSNVPKFYRVACPATNEHFRQFDCRWSGGRVPPVLPPTHMYITHMYIEVQRRSTVLAAGLQSNRCFGSGRNLLFPL
jgi:hypothetical protein